MICTPPKTLDFSADAFAKLLARLAPDPTQAGELYEEQRRMLVKFFECRSVAFAEDLADVVLNRVARRLEEGEKVENLPGYCFSVARFVLLEHLRSPEQRRVELDDLPPLVAPEREPEDEDARLTCLRRCLQNVSDENRALLFAYYGDETRARIDVRQSMANRLGITRNALSNRMVRLRTQLEQCITRCVKKNAAQNRKS